MNNLQERVVNNYIKTRGTVRMTNVVVNFPPNFFKAGEDVKLLEKLFYEKLHDGLQERWLRFLHEFDLKQEQYYIVKIAQLMVKKDGQIRPDVTLSATAPVGHTDVSATYTGTVFVGISKNDVALGTIKLVYPDDITSGKVARDHIAHLQDEKLTVQDFEVEGVTKFPLIIDVDRLIDDDIKRKTQIKSGPKTPNDLPYKVRADYRNSTSTTPSFFTHKDYGKGKIIHSDPGMTSTGRWGRIDVKFPDGKTREFYPYTTSYFSRKQNESLIKKLEQLSGKKVILK